MSDEVDDAFRPSRLRAVLEHFARIEDPREPPKIRCPLHEVNRPGLSEAVWFELRGHGHLVPLRIALGFRLTRFRGSLT